MFVLTCLSVLAIHSHPRHLLETSPYQYCTSFWVYSLSGWHHQDMWELFALFFSILAIYILWMLFKMPFYPFHLYAPNISPLQCSLQMVLFASWFVFLKFIFLVIFQIWLYHSSTWNLSVTPRNLGDSGSSLAQKAMTWFTYLFPPSQLPFLPSSLPVLLQYLLISYVLVIISGTRAQK